MPALKMKSKSSKDCIRGDKLHACRRSSKISKGSHFEAKASQLSDDKSTQVPLDDSVVEVSGENIHTTEVIQQEDSFLQASTPLLKLPSSMPDVTSADRNGSLAAGCQSILETIFSPILDHSDVQGTLVDNNIEDKEQADLPHLVPDDSDDGSCTSCDFQSCNVIDYCISDSSDPLAFNGSMGFSDAISGSCSDYDNADYDMMFDLPERYMILPFVERTRQDSNFQYDDSIEEAAVNSDDSCLYLAIHQLKSSDEDIGCHSWDVEDLGSFDPQLFIKNLPDLPEAVSSLWPMLLPKETRKRKAITLVLDLDETLVHSTLEYCADADFTFPVFFNMKEHTVYIRQRPYLHIFLERVAQMFEIVIFTASQSIYAEQLLDILDPGKKLISRRIYRESCIFSEGSYTKDLTILGVDLAKVFIIDNSPQVFRLQVNNGIPIKSWFDDPSDCALISLLPFLESLVDVDDVRPLIAERFNKE